MTSQPKFIPEIVAITSSVPPLKRFKKKSVNHDIELNQVISRYTVCNWTPTRIVLIVHWPRLGACITWDFCRNNFRLYSRELIHQRVNKMKFYIRSASSYHILIAQYKGTKLLTHISFWSRTLSRDATRCFDSFVFVFYFICGSDHWCGWRKFCNLSPRF